MSLNVFPTLKGIAWPVTVTPVWNNQVQVSVTGRRVTSTYQQYPLFKFKVSFNFLLAADFNTLMAFFNQQGGNLTPFWLDAGVGQDSVSGQVIGTGDGTTTTFTLLRSYGGFTEPVAASFGSPSAYESGSYTSGVVWNNPTNGPASVTFNTAPVAGKVITWTGSYHFQCYFTKGSTDIEEFASQLYSSKSLEMETFW